MKLIRDIGIDLGTANVLCYEEGRGIVLREPSVVAVDKNTGKVLQVGAAARNMLGRTPGNIVAVRPLRDGVISDYEMTEKMLEQFLKKINKFTLVKPRVIVSVPSGITEVEERAVIQAAMEAGARRVYLIEEPFAAALGAKLAISGPEGHMVVDIGGGTTDIAVLSLNGIATSSSIKVAGDQFNEAVVKYMRRKHNLLIGERTAEEMKMSIGCVFPPEEEMTMEIKGRCLLTGLPKLITVTSTEMMDAFEEPVERIMEAVANYFYIPVEQMISKDRSKDVAYPRQMAMYMIRQELEYSFPDIAKIFKRDHTTVMHACNKIEEERKKSRQTEDVIKKLHNNIRGD